MTSDSASASGDEDRFHDLPPATAPSVHIPVPPDRPLTPVPTPPLPPARSRRHAASRHSRAVSGGSSRGAASLTRSEPYHPDDDDDTDNGHLHAVQRKVTSLKLLDLRQRTSEPPPAPRTLSARALSRRSSRHHPLTKSSSSSLKGAFNFIKVKASGKKTTEFANLVKWQTLTAHQGPVLALRFSPNAEYLATAGQDLLIKLWDLAHAPDAPPRRNRDRAFSRGDSHSTTSTATSDVFLDSSPVRVLAGHRAEILDLSWSKNCFLLSSSKDATVRLWHPENETCLQLFQHSDQVTTVTFHPYIESKFITGSMDGHIRLWSIYPKATQLSVAHVEDIVTTSTINRDGKTVIIGTYGGRAKFYSLSLSVDTAEWTMHHTTQLEVRSRRGKNTDAQQITAINFRPNVDEFLVSSNDSRLRLYSSDDKAMLCNFSGHTAVGSNFKASFSETGRFVLCASEDSSVYLWEVSDGLLTQNARQRERVVPHESFQPHDGDKISVATFAPTGALDMLGVDGSAASGLVILTASSQGELCVFQNIGSADRL